MLEPAAQLVPWKNNAFASLSKRGLSLYSFDDPDAPDLIGQLHLSPYFAHLWVFGDYFARLKLPVGFESLFTYVYHSPHADGVLSLPDALMAHLEVFPIEAEPESDAPITRIPVNPWAHFVRAGDLLLSFISTDPDFESDPVSGQTRLKVFDMTKPDAPKLRAEMTTDTLWVNQCLDCFSSSSISALTVANGMIIASRDSESTTESRRYAYTFQAVDLSDPDNPRIGDPVQMPSQEHGLGAFSDGTRVFYIYKVPITSDEQVTFARFYFKGIELSDSDSSALRIDEPSNVPGELLAVKDEVLYTREIVHDESGFQSVVNRLELSNGAASKTASQKLGERWIGDARLDGQGHLLIDLLDRFNRIEPDNSARFYYPQPPLNLQILDAQSLEPIGETDVAAHGIPVYAANGRAVYHAHNKVVIVDLSDPSAPVLQATFPISTFRRDIYGYQLIVDGLEIWVLDQGSLNRYSIDTQN